MIVNPVRITIKRRTKMSKMIRRMITTMVALTLFASVLTGCGKAKEPVAAEPETAADVSADEGYEDDAVDYEDTDIEDDADIEDDVDIEDDYDTDIEDDVVDEDDATVYDDASEDQDPEAQLSNDQIVELAKKHSGAPVAELDQVMDNGNLYIHLYEDMDDHTATIDWYEIDPKTLKGTNFEGEAVDLSSAEASSAGSYDSEGDEGEGVAIADGEYVTDEEYKGELSADGKTMTITTALSEFVNSPKPSYPKQTYVITVADDCKCIEVQEEEKVSSFFDKMDLINDFLKGKSGLPITLKFKNNELIEIMFSS